DDDNELTHLESFETTIDKEDSHDDEYIYFRETIEMLKFKDQNWYNHLFGGLNQSQFQALEEVFVLAQRRKDAASKLVSPVCPASAVLTPSPSPSFSFSLDRFAQD